MIAPELMRVRSREVSRDFYVQAEALISTSSASRGPGLGPKEASAAETLNTGDSMARTGSTRPIQSISDCTISYLRFLSGLEKPFLPQTQAMKRAGIQSGSKQLKIKRECIRHGLIRVHTIQQGKTSLSFWELTEKAYGQIGVNLRKFSGKGGFLHQCLQYHVAEWGRFNGYKSTMEYLLPNLKAVDVALESGDELVFVEVAISQPFTKELNNFTADLSTDKRPDKLILVATDSRKRRELESLIRSDPQANLYLSHIQFKLAGEFVISNQESL